MMSKMISCFNGSISSDAKSISKEIERQLREAKKEARSQVKLLVLGTAESGKSTFIKQMRIIHGRGFSHDQRMGYISLICQNINVAVKMLISAMDKLGIEYENNETKTVASQLSDQVRSNESELSQETAELIGKLWGDGGIQKCYLRRNEFHLLDSTSYYMNSLTRIASPDYVPTEQDILRSRVPTSGIVEYLFDIDRFMFGIVDVGGQKSERRKWIHCFENVTSIIFLAALSEYDQTIPAEEISQDLRNCIRNLSMSDSPPLHSNNSHKRTILRTNSEQLKLANERHGFSKHGGTRKLPQRQYSSVYTQRPGAHNGGKSIRGLPPFPTTSHDRSTPSPTDKRRLHNQREPEPEMHIPSINRLDESCALFKTIVQNEFFRNTSVILFLNKTDILEEKIQHSALSEHFPVFPGPDKDAKAAGEFILSKYVKCFERVKHTKRTLYTHFTCATDTNNIRFVFAAIKDIILQSYLVNYNLV